MHFVDRSLLDCDPFGVIPINDTTPPFICALFGNDAQATAGVTYDIEACCSPYYPPQYTTGNGCDHDYPDNIPLTNACHVTGPTMPSTATDEMSSDSAC